jgi:Ca2+-binding RTX toxin-like protein
VLPIEFDIQEPDHIDFGPGIDTADYGGAGSPLHVDLSDPGPDGVAGALDTLIGAENVRGGREDDVLIGGPGPNVLDGDEGNDTLRAMGGGIDTLVCGKGTDHYAADAADVLRGCEVAERR